MRGQNYTEPELAWMSENRTLTCLDFHKQFQSKFQRNVSANALGLKRRSFNWMTGRRGFIEIEKDGLQIHASIKQIGTERISEGLRYRKIHDGLPKRTRWRMLHYVTWEEKHGPVPTGMRLKCRGDRLNVDPSNWDLISPGMALRMNDGRMGLKYDDAPQELKPTMIALARLEDTLRSPWKAARKA